MIVARKSTEKKMQPSFDLQAPLVKQCLPPTLKNTTCKGWRIEYYFTNPYTGANERRTIRLNKYEKKCRTRTDFRNIANRLISQISLKLSMGWTPYGTVQTDTCMSQPIMMPTAAIEVPDAMISDVQKKAMERRESYVADLAAKYLKEKERETRDRSFSTYKSHIEVFLGWLKESYSGLKIKDFTADVANDYMDYYYLERKVVKKNKETGETEELEMSANTYNNVLKYMRLFCCWLVSKNYLKDNPFGKIKKKQKEEKKRVVIPDHERKMISEYFEKNYPNYLVLCHLVFTSFIRPIEISRIKVKDIHLSKMYIYMPGSITKNKHERYAPLSKELCRMLAPMLNGADGEYFLFGEGYKPGPVAVHHNTYSKRWAKMREKLNIPENRQLYSLRDTGLTLLLQAGATPDVVMKAADHHDLSITTQYIKGVDPDLIEKVTSVTPAFFGGNIKTEETEVDDLTEKLLKQFD